MDDDVNFRKVFLMTMIISLSISALIGIIIFLIGEFGDIEARILFTTLTIGGFSLTALCSSALQEKHRFAAFAKTGMAISVLGFIMTTLAIWEILDSENIWKVIVIIIILSASVAHISLLLLIRSKKTNVNVSLMLTLLFILIVAIMLIILVLGDFNMDFEFYYRLLGVFAILDVLGTIVTPILKKVSSMNMPSNVQNM